MSVERMTQEATSSLALRRDFSLVFVLALCLYLPFLSANYDLNGVIEARELEAHHLISPNHVLYRVVGFLIYEFLRLFGYRGRSLEILQIFTALCGALGVGFAYLAFYRLGESRGGH